MGFEPTASRATIWRANQLRYTHHIFLLSIRTTNNKTSLKGFEPPTHGLEGRCSIQLSYRLMKAGDGNRTHVISLEGWSSTIELHPLIVGVTGFEPATSWSQIKRSSQAEPHPVSACLFCYFLNSKIYYIESPLKCQQLFSSFFIFSLHFATNRLFMRFFILYFFHF